MGFLHLLLLCIFMAKEGCSFSPDDDTWWEQPSASYSRDRNASASSIAGGQWKPATATYTKETNGSIITEGACGYGDLHKVSYGNYSAGLSTMLFDRGSACGACFELRCVDHVRWCLPGSPTVVLTATDFCPPNYGLSADYGGWCNFPQEHFEMSEAAFAEIAERMADIVPMARNWGQNWQCYVDLKGQPLSFEVTTSDKRTLTSYNVAPANWQFGQTFVGKQF